MSAVPIARARGPREEQRVRTRRRAEADSPRDDEKLLCAACGHAITRRRHRTSVNGAHHHTCTNPHGLVFDIGCFSEAPGCAETGNPTYEWTWFQGFMWRLALCGGCGAHMGWGYRTESGDGFYGLILERIVAPS